MTPVRISALRSARFSFSSRELPKCPVWPDGGVVTQRTANPYTPVRFRLGPPFFLLPEMSNVGISQAPGGIFLSGALRGTYFGPGGAPGQFNFGSIVNDRS